MSLGGYFIAPSGDIIETDKTHIDLVLTNPEKFLLTQKDIEDTYKKYNEPIGLEGKAREEILSDLIRRGWMRVRFMPKKDAFTIQVNRLDNRKKDQIANFAKHAMDGINGQKFHGNVDINILDLNADILAKHTLKQLVEDILYTTAKAGKVINISEYVPTPSEKIRACFISGLKK